MTIYRLLKKAEGRHLIVAYELTLRALALADRNDPLTVMIANKVMEIGCEARREVAQIQLGHLRGVNGTDAPLLSS